MEFLAFSCYKKTSNVSIRQMMSTFFRFSLLQIDGLTIVQSDVNIWSVLLEIQRERIKLTPARNKVPSKR